jgi:hypothetical protein
MSKVDSITLISALTGLIGTTGGLVISYLTLKHVYRKDKHLVKVEIAKAMLVTPQANTTKAKVSEEMLTVKVVNAGAKDFKVTAIGIAIGRRSGGLYINEPFGTVKLPHNLAPDETCDFWTEYKGLLKDIKKPKLYNHVKIRAYTRDYIGNAFYSNKLTVTFNETRLTKVLAKIKKQVNNLRTLIRP